MCGGKILDLAPVIQCITLQLIRFGCKLGSWVVRVCVCLCVSVCVCLCVCAHLHAQFIFYLWKSCVIVLMCSSFLSPIILQFPHLLFYSWAWFPLFLISLHHHNMLSESSYTLGRKVLPLPIVLYSNCNPSLKLSDRNSKWQNCWNQLV